jgi:gamma-glutamylcysteine synthetase
MPKVGTLGLDIMFPTCTVQMIIFLGVPFSE